MKNILQHAPHLADIIGVPKAFRDIAIDSYHPAGLVAKGMEAITNGKSVYLCGDVGRGKSYIAAYWCLLWAMNNLGKRDGAPRFVVVPDIFDQLKEEFDGGSAKKVMFPLKRCPLLVLDNFRNDVGAWRNEVFFSLINSRYNDNLPTVITTTVPFAEFAKNDSDSASRLTQTALILTVTGKDRRKK